MGWRSPKSKIHSPAVGGFPQIDALFYDCLAWAFAAAASAADLFATSSLEINLEATLQNVRPSIINLRIRAVINLGFNIVKLKPYIWIEIPVQA